MSKRFRRKDIYNTIDGERDYQDIKWPNREHSIEEYTLYMFDYLDEAKHLLSRYDTNTVYEEVLSTIRKITALGVSCMEDNGFIERKTKKEYD